MLALPSKERCADPLAAVLALSLESSTNAHPPLVRSAELISPSVPQCCLFGGQDSSADRVSGPGRDRIMLCSCSYLRQDSQRPRENK